MNGATPPGLVCDGLADRRGFRDLFSELRFSVSPGTLLEITGANGSGKSTLLQSLAGLRRPEAGQVLWQGSPLNESGDFHRNLRYIGHRSAIKAALTPRENLQSLLALSGQGGDTVEPALRALGLAASIDLPCRQLSAGQKRRVALARLAASPGRLWILDEPFSALDEQGRGWVVQAIRDFCEGQGIVILTTHHLIDVPGLQPQRLRLAA